LTKLQFHLSAAKKGQKYVGTGSSLSMGEQQGQVDLINEQLVHYSE
jgi:hypothetical protein